jgi:hypothetical protein
MVNTSVDFSLNFADVRDFKADVLILKYAQSNHGIDKIISCDLNQVGKLNLNAIKPQIGEFVFVKNVGTTKFENILFIGVPYLDEFENKSENGYIERLFLTAPFHRFEQSLQ